ncbi:hypothetical protein PUN28_013698 [Cardiocondyla obscurior]|uniref:Uncharacterized protein n=1 Tax=Cardiocondyla obscurior TaxID=286306 RepID=A0AAW2F4T6_9HYME
MGISMPVAMTKRGGIAFSSGFQLNYALPWNLSQLEPMIIPARHIRDLDLQETYVAIENLLDEPTEDLPVAINSSHRSANKLYQEAERLGRSGGDCVLTYPDCIESPLESFTEIVFH